MNRPQFSLKTMLWLTVVVAALLGGIQFERHHLAKRRTDGLRSRTITESDFDWAPLPVWPPHSGTKEQPNTRWAEDLSVEEIVGSGRR